MRCTMVGLNSSRRAISRTPMSPPSASTISSTSRPRSSDCDPAAAFAWRGIGLSLLDLDEAGQLDLAVQHGVQRHPVTGLVVIVELHDLAHDVGEGHSLHRVL